MFSESVPVNWLLSETSLALEAQQKAELLLSQFPSYLQLGFNASLIIL